MKESEMNYMIRQHQTASKILTQPSLQPLKLVKENGLLLDWWDLKQAPASQACLNNILQPTLQLGSERPLTLRQVDSLVTSPQRTCKH